MSRMLPRTIESRYIPKGSTKVADKKSDAIAYVGINPRNKPYAVIYFGKQSRPVCNFYYGTESARNKAVLGYFASRQMSLASKAEYAAKRKAFVNPYKVGDIFKSVWGYDQTNVDYYECVKVSGSIMTVREIAGKSIENGQWMTGKCTPQPGAFTGKEKRVKAQDGGFRVASYAFASYQKPQMIAGIPVYGVDSYSSYA